MSSSSGRSARIYHYLGVESPFDPQHRYVTSYFLPVWALAVLRLLIGLYAFITLVYSTARDGSSSFSYFTNLTYWGLFGYFTISGIHTASFWWSYRRWSRARSHSDITSAPFALPREGATRNDVARGFVSSDQAFSGLPDPNIDFALTYHGKQDPIDVGRVYPRSWLSAFFPRPLQFFHVLLVSTITTYPLVVTIVFWTLLSGDGVYEDAYSTWGNLTKHALNLAFTQLDVTILGRAPMCPWWHMLFVVFIIACYVGVAYITYADQGFYPYDFLNQGENGTGIVAAYVVGIGVGTVISFLIGDFLIFLREWIAARIQRSGGWGSAKAVGVLDDACIPTRRGPGPEGEGGLRPRDSTSNYAGLRGRWPANALWERMQQTKESEQV